MIGIVRNVLISLENVVYFRRDDVNLIELKAG